MSKSLTIEDLPAHIFETIVLFGVSPVEMMPVNRHFLNIFGPILYRSVHCIYSADFAWTKKVAPPCEDEVRDGYHKRRGTMMEMMPVSETKVTLISKCPQLIYFVFDVLIEGHLMKKFIKNLSFDVLIVEDDECLDMNTKLLKDTYGIVDIDDVSNGYRSTLITALQDYVPFRKLIERDFSIFSTRSSSLEAKRASPNEVHFHNEAHKQRSIYQSNQLTLPMQIVYNYLTGKRFTRDPFQEYNSIFKDVQIRHDDFTTLFSTNGLTLLPSYTKRMRKMSSLIDLQLSPEMITNTMARSQVYEILKSIIIGLYSLSPSCKGEFCGILVKSRDGRSSGRTSRNSPDIITSQRAKLVGFKVGPQW